MFMLQITHDDYSFDMILRHNAAGIIYLFIYLLIYL